MTLYTYVYSAIAQVMISILGTVFPSGSIEILQPFNIQKERMLHLSLKQKLTVSGSHQKPKKKNASYRIPNKKKGSCSKSKSR